MGLKFRREEKIGKNLRVFSYGCFVGLKVCGYVFIL